MTRGKEVDTDVYHIRLSLPRVYKRWCLISKTLPVAGRSQSVTRSSNAAGGVLYLGSLIFPFSSVLLRQDKYPSKRGGAVARSSCQDCLLCQGVMEWTGSLLCPRRRVIR